MEFSSQNGNGRFGEHGVLAGNFLEGSFIFSFKSQGIGVVVSLALGSTEVPNSTNKLTIIRQLNKHKQAFRTFFLDEDCPTFDGGDGCS
jgi:hypothetical protein